MHVHNKWAATAGGAILLPQVLIVVFSSSFSDGPLFVTSAISLIASGGLAMVVGGHAEGDDRWRTIAAGLVVLAIGVFVLLTQVQPSKEQFVSQADALFVLALAAQLFWESARPQVARSSHEHLTDFAP